MTSELDRILEQSQRWRHADQGVALATVVATWGSSPRPIGSHLAVNESGEFAGSVSGGCIEGAVIQEALAAIGDGQPRLLEFGVSDEQAWEVGLACGGRVQVHVEKLDPAIFDHLMRERAARQPVARVIRLSDKTAALVTADDVIGNSAVADSHRAALAARFANGQSGAIDERGDVFARVYVPAPRLLIVGAVHIAQALAPMATLAGFDVTVVDPRRAFASEARFPGVTLTDDWPDDALTRLAPDAQTAVVTLSHDPKIDDPALAVALASPAFYIGSLGSKRTHEMRVARLTELGLADRIGRIHAPIGLDLGGRYPSEIAVAILAQIIQVRYKGQAR
ncbi:MAG: XdhC family protein [Rhodocyclaceae bacterium]|nr:XdhC family protein [Rhodocyclaceae bacterium]